jgi:Leucine-rich repeat (LRR) protein
MIMSKRDISMKKQSSDTSYAVSAIIQECRREQLPQLDLSSKGLVELPDSIGHLTHLRQLILAQNELVTLPEFIGELTELERLDLTGNQLKELPRV